jgi:ribosome recycling factor
MIKDLVLVENDTKTFQKAMEDAMTMPIKHLEGELVKVRTGRAHTSLIENLPVSVYGGAPMALKNVAACAAPDARLLTIQPWDSGIIGEIEKAISNSDLGLSPANDGQIIRLTLPEMSTNRREELVKILHKKVEECKISIRNIRKDFNNLIRDAKKDKAISENFFNRLDDLLQKVTDRYCELADEKGEKKAKEIREF